jgi:hypothetical protein
VGLASHSGSCEQGCADQRSRQKFKFSHSISPLGFEKANGVGSSLEMEKRSTD